jgi:hypothetical protein
LYAAPNRAVETGGETPPPPLSLLFFSASVMFDELPPTNFLCYRS